MCQDFKSTEREAQTLLLPLIFTQLANQGMKWVRILDFFGFKIGWAQPTQTDVSVSDSVYFWPLQLQLLGPLQIRNL